MTYDGGCGLRHAPLSDLEPETTEGGPFPQRCLKMMTIGVEKTAARL